MKDADTKPPGPILGMLTGEERTRWANVRNKKRQQVSIWNKVSIL
jgi:hypothetical protein